MRPTSNGKLENGLAEKVEISPDLSTILLQYAKHNGLMGLLDAHDIEY